MNYEQFSTWLEEMELDDIASYVRDKKLSLEDFWKECNDGEMLIEVFANYAHHLTGYAYARNHYNLFNTAVSILKETIDLYGFHLDVAWLLGDMVSYWKDGDIVKKSHSDFLYVAEELYCINNSTLDQESLSNEDNLFYKFKRAIYGIMVASKKSDMILISYVAQCNNSQLAAELIKKNLECPKIELQVSKRTEYLYGGK